jgi:hypothetical protein
MKRQMSDKNFFRLSISKVIYLSLPRIETFSAKKSMCYLENGEGDVVLDVPVCRHDGDGHGDDFGDEAKLFPGSGGVELHAQAVQSGKWELPVDNEESMVR